ncbi:MAG TPA: glycosyltransferase family 39 protein [Kiritimatiellia bacterium]|nr:glycosyltransferase family 39 protein [Kiritimatiellia bacterium]
MRTLKPVYSVTSSASDPDSPERWFDRNRRIILLLAWLVILTIALFFRTAGLYRGLDAQITFHPDAPKQVMSFHNYVNYRYIWYDGTLFMDGYPLFLNHVDEWITRPLFALKEFAVKHLYSAHETKRLEGVPHEDFYPKGWWLFHWLRGLRVFYSLLILVGAYALARALDMSKRISFFVALIMALSPMEWVLAHYDTGDIGVSLFGVAMWLALARHARTDRITMLLFAGILGGFAFASKYQGLLVCGVVYTFLVFRHAFIAWEPAKFATRFLAFTGALLAGIVIATPQFFIHPGRTRKLIFENIEFIKNYQVPKEILDKPFLEKAMLGMQKNTWPLLENLGFILLGMALIGTIIAGVQLWRRARRAEIAPASLAAVAFSLFALPFYALFLSLAGKYNVQPFHFAYLMVPLVLAAVYFIRALWHSRRKTAKLGALIAAPALLLSDAGLMIREYHFWSREDTVEVMKHFQHEIFEHFDQRPPDIRPIRIIHTEPVNLPVFRNRHQFVRLPYSSFWREQVIAPVPSIPFPGRTHWVFANGPSFPKNDRMFVIPRNETVRKSLVWHKPPEFARLGLRSGLFPSWITVRTGSLNQEYRLPPNKQIIIDLPLDAVRPLVRHDEHEQPAWHLHVSIAAQNAPAWATLLPDAKSKSVYRLFGGGADVFPELLRDDIGKRDEIAAQINLCQYYGNTRDFGFDLAPGRDLQLLNYQPLAGGVYEFNSDVVVASERATLVLRGSEIFAGNDWSNAAWSARFELSAGHHRLTHKFEKPLAPFTYQMSLAAEGGTAKVVSWKLKPDAIRILDDLRVWDEQLIRPAWTQFHHPQPDETASNVKSTGIIFGGVFELLHVHLPEQSGSRGELTANVSIRQLKPLRHVHEQVFFIHFVNELNQTAGVMTFPAYRALVNERTDHPITVPIDTTLSGHHRVLVGMVSARTLKRLPIIAGSPDQIVRDRRIHVGDIVFP